MWGATGLKPEQWKQQLEAFMEGFLAKEGETPEQATEGRAADANPGGQGTGKGPLVVIEDARYRSTWWGGRRLLSDPVPERAPGELFSSIDLRRE